MAKYTNHPLCPDYFKTDYDLCGKCIKRDWNILTDDQLNYFLTYSSYLSLSFPLFKKILKRVNPNIGYKQEYETDYVLRNVCNAFQYRQLVLLLKYENISVSHTRFGKTCFVEMCLYYKKHEYSEKRKLVRKCIRAFIKSGLVTQAEINTVKQSPYVTARKLIKILDMWEWYTLPDIKEPSVEK